MAQVIIALFWINWMTVSLAYFLEWTIFASHTEVTACDWTLAGWCCVLCSQCTRIHPMIHQCHLDLFVKCSRKYTQVSFFNDMEQAMIIIYHHNYGTRLHLYQRYVRILLISIDVANSDRYQQLPFQSTSTSTFLDATTSHQSSLIVLKFIVLWNVLL